MFAVADDSTSADIVGIETAAPVAVAVVDDDVGAAAADDDAFHAASVFLVEVAVDFAYRRVVAGNDACKMMVVFELVKTITIDDSS